MSLLFLVYWRDLFMPFLYVSYILYIPFLAFFCIAIFLWCIFFSHSCSRSLCYRILLFSLIVFIYRSQVSNYSPESVYVWRIRKFILVREDGGCVFFCLGEKKRFLVSRKFFFGGRSWIVFIGCFYAAVFLISVFFCCVHSLSSVVLIIITMMIIRFPAFGIVQILVSTRKIFFAHLKLNFLYFFFFR